MKDVEEEWVWGSDLVAVGSEVVLDGAIAKINQETLDRNCYVEQRGLGGLEQVNLYQLCSSQVCQLMPASNVRTNRDLWHKAIAK